MRNGLIIELDPPPKRLAKCQGNREWHLTEAAVMLALANHLLQNFPSVRRVYIHPDGEHGKRFPIRDWLEDQGFRYAKGIGTTSYGGEYVNGDRVIVVNPKSGLGDVVAELNGTAIVAECKGGIINTRHPGQLSRMYRGLCEAVGSLMGKALGGTQIAAVPRADVTLRLAQRMAPRANAAGVEIVLIDAAGNVFEVNAADDRANAKSPRGYRN